MFYSTSYTTLWHDADPWGHLRPSSVLKYMQETGNRQCRDYGYDLDTMFRRDRRGFILARLRMSVLRPIHAYEDIEVRTWCPPSRGVTFLRCFAVLRGGETVAEAASYWALVDADTRSFIKVSDFDRDFPAGDMLPETSLPRMAWMPPALETEEAGQHRVTAADLDFNMHMNNTKYPDAALDALPPEAMRNKWVSSLSISYTKEAPFGEVLSMRRTQDAATGAWLVKGVRTDGEVCFAASLGLSEEQY